MTRRKMISVICLLASSFVAVPVLSIVPAIAHDDAHDGGSLEQMPSRDGSPTQNNGSESNAERAREDQRLLDEFRAGQDNCYPEWGVDRTEHPFRSEDCPD